MTRTTLSWRRNPRIPCHDLRAGKIFIGWINGRHRQKWAGHLVLDGDGGALNLPLAVTLRRAKAMMEHEAARLLGERV